MKRLLRVLPLLALGFIGACDEPEYEDADGNLLGEGLRDDLLLDTVTSEVHPSEAGYCDPVTNAIWNDSWETLETQVIAEMNKRRLAGATCGGVAKAKVAAVTLNTKLRCAARKHSKDMKVNNFFSHTGSNGSTPWARIKAAGVQNAYIFTKYKYYNPEVSAYEGVDPLTIGVDYGTFPQARTFTVGLQLGL